MKKLILFSLVLFITGCVGSPVHSTVKYSSIQSKIKKNNSNLLTLKIGVTKDETINILGDPERSEGYSWGSVWLYRTAMTSGVYCTADSDFTPIVFNQDGKIVGGGRNFFTEHIKRFEVTVK